MDNQEIAESVMSTLRQIIRAIDLQSKQITKKYGLTGPQLIILKEIKRNPDKPIAVISSHVSLSQATVTSILDRLEQQGFAVRKRSDKDKRKVNIFLTEKAEAILDCNPSLLQEEFTDSFIKLEEWEQNQMLSTLQRISRMMNADVISTSPNLHTEIL